jgi:hypothetical protein
LWKKYAEQETSVKAGDKQTCFNDSFYDPEDGGDMFLQNVG